MLMNQGIPFDALELRDTWLSVFGSAFVPYNRHLALGRLLTIILMAEENDEPTPMGTWAKETLVYGIQARWLTITDRNY